MARFRGTMEGVSGHEVSRLGGTNTGLRATVNGWTSGIEVRAACEDGEDIFRVYRTGGSHGSESRFIGELHEDGVWITADDKE